MGTQYQYSFDHQIDIDAVRATLSLATLGVSSLRGETVLQLDAAFRLNLDAHTCMIDGTTEVGAELNRLFHGFLTQEFGARSFSVVRLHGGLEPARSAA